MCELDGALFDTLMPIEIKALVFEKLIDTYALETRDSILPYELWELISTITLEDLRRNSVNPLGSERYLLTNAYQLERLEDSPSSYLAIQLATHWGLVDQVHLTTLQFSGCSALWDGPRFDGFVVDKLHWEEIAPYCRLISRPQFCFDPFAYEEWVEYLVSLERDREEGEN